MVTELTFSPTYNHRRTLKTRKERGSDTKKFWYETREGGGLHSWRKEDPGEGFELWYHPMTDFNDFTTFFFLFISNGILPLKDALSLEVLMKIKSLPSLEGQCVLL